MLLILDFDGVLFDGEKFKKAYFQIFRDAGMTTDAVHTAYRAGRTHARKYPHTMMRAAARHTDCAAIARRVDALLKTAPKYLYRDTKKFLRWCGQERVTLAIVSRGPAFQKRKIAASGIKRFFKKVIIIPDGPKSEAIRKIMRTYPRDSAVFVDDTAEVVDEVKQSLPVLTAVQMTRRRGMEKSVRADACAASFAGIARILQRKLRG